LNDSTTYGNLNGTNSTPYGTNLDGMDYTTTINQPQNVYPLPDGTGSTPMSQDEAAQECSEFCSNYLFHINMTEIAFDILTCGTIISIVVV
jgi:hypothetical protein